jgi:phospholipid transport system substrate-binding protein
MTGQRNASARKAGFSVIKTRFPARLAGVLLIASCIPAGMSLANETGPDEAVIVALADLAGAVQPRREELRGNRQATVRIVDSFLQNYADIRLACGFILGAHWKSATSDQRKRFESAFNRHVNNLLVDLVTELDFGGIAVERFEGDPEEQPVTVKATLRKVNGDLLHFDFRMHDKPGDWRIFDVTAEGVSYVRLYNSEFRQEILRHGLDEAITRFTERSIAKANVR